MASLPSTRPRRRAAATPSDTSRPRRLLAGALRRFGDRDLTVRNHHTGDPFRVHAYLHRAYWLGSRQRTSETIRSLADFVSTGDTVIEVGAHIGYVSQVLARLVGGSGRVVAFEPGPNNLPYLCRNLRPLRSVTVEPVAVSGASGQATLHIEHLSGANNSLLAPYDLYERNRRAAGRHELLRLPCRVATVGLDEYVAGHRMAPSFVKIDAQGHEITVLQGMTATLEHLRPTLLVRVISRRRPVWNLLSEYEYRLLSPRGARLHSAEVMGADVYALPAEAWSRRTGRSRHVLPASSC